MKKLQKSILPLILCLFCLTAAGQNTYDLVIVGGTPGGITTAIAAAKEGRNSVILERTEFPGGLPVNGLGATDIATRNATTGIFKDFTNRQLAYYTEKYGKDSKQVRDCSSGYHFEPHVAAIIFEDMLSEYKDKITVLTSRQFDADPKNIEMQNQAIVSIRILNRKTGAYETYSGKIFVDATYEGDLSAAAGVPFRTGREGKDEYNEWGAGRIYKYWKGPEGEGSTFQGDNALQAYNYRLCLTNDPQNRVLPEKPEKYNREEYLSLIDDVYSGRHCGQEMQKVTPAMMEENRKQVAEGKRTGIPGDAWGMAKISSMTALPNMKTDANNQHLAFLSTDLPEENWPWPTSGWDWRDRFAERLKSYTLGLLWFAQNDPELPEHFRNACREWGLSKDEYTDNNHFPRQVYVREGRRMEGVYFFTAQDAIPVAPGQRPPLHASSITASHYALDSHAVRKREPGKIHLDGFFSYPSAVYNVPYGVIVPQKITNLLMPVPASGSHVGFSTLRMEPCWMALGEAAGSAASIAIDRKKEVQNIPVEELQDILIKNKATLIYYEDIMIDNPDFGMVQYIGIRGYLPGWKAELDAAPTKEDIRNWEALSKTKIGTSYATKREALYFLYNKIKQKTPKITTTK